MNQLSIPYAAFHDALQADFHQLLASQLSPETNEYRHKIVFGYVERNSKRIIHFINHLDESNTMHLQIVKL